MSEQLTVILTLQAWELENFQELCDQCGWSQDLMLEQFIHWCVNDPEGAEEWLRDELC